MRNALMIAAAVLLLTDAAVAQVPTDCKVIGDTVARLACYDAAAAAPKQPASKVPTGKPIDPMIARAKSAVSKLLREPATATFSDIRIVTADDGSKGACGNVNARNGLGGMSGPRHFVHDGKITHVFVGEGGSNNPTTLSGLLIELSFRDAAAVNKKYCAAR